MAKLTADRARELINYDRESGVCRWRISRTNAPAGKIVGGLMSKGYMQVRIDGERLLLHRVIFLIETGKWPSHEIDHRDLSGASNCWNNIRPATRSQNMGNCSRRKDNKSGYKGVRLLKGRWQARITIKGKSCFLGSFPTAEKAHAAYFAAATKAFGEFRRAA